MGSRSVADCTPVMLCRLRIRMARAVATRPFAYVAMVGAITAAIAFAPVANAAPSADAPAKKHAAVAKPAHQSSSEVFHSAKSESEKLDLPSNTDKGTKQSTSASSSSSSGAIGRMLLGFGFVIGLIFAVHKLLKSYNSSRFPGMAGNGGGAIEVLATTPLAAGRMLHLVKVGAEVVLVGATDQSITRLGTLDAQQAMNAAGDAGNAEFQQLLNGAMIGSGPNTAAKQDTFFRRFVANLQLMTAR